MKKPYPASSLRIIIAVLLLVLFAFSLKAQNPTPIAAQKQLSVIDMNMLNTASQQRLPKAQACMELKQIQVKLVLWDCGIEDNDTVSINLNGVWILHHFRLTNAKQEIDITLNPGENQLTLLANNLGDIPDNTAAMAVKENGVEQKATLSSNMQTNGTLKLLVKGGAGIQSILTNCPQDQVYMDDENQQVRANPDLTNPAFNFLYSGVRKNPYEAPRQLEMQGCTNIADSVVTLYFWDSGVEDNDTISINLNGVWVVNNLRLSKQKQSVQVKLQSGSNYIIMYANNLGDIPNNTSGIGVKYTFGERDLGTLYSDKNTSGTFRFNSTACSNSVATASAPCIKTTTASAKAKNDPEMQYLYGQRTSNPTNQQPTQYNPKSQPNYAPAVSTGVAIGVGVISTLPRGGSGNKPQSGNTGSSPRKPTDNNPPPTRNPNKPVNY